jgi:protocatechuate 3,4-dioxygenase beta subunit
MTTQAQVKKRDWTLHPKAATTQPLVPIKHTLSELTGPVFGHNTVKKMESDLTKNAAKKGKEAIGERMILTGRVTDEANRPVPGALVEIWQTNAAGLYGHKGDQHDAPVDPNFYGTGRCVTDSDGNYRFVTIRPGAYPITRLGNRWRPAHIHYSINGGSFAQRLVTQCYFPGDPLQEADFVFQAVTNKAARDRLIVEYAPEHSVMGFAAGYRFDIVLRGQNATPMEQ